MVIKGRLISVRMILLFSFTWLIMTALNVAEAVDSSTAPVVSVNATPFQYSYILYQSPLFYVDNPANMNVRTANPPPTPGLKCKTGFAACVALHGNLSNPLNANGQLPCAITQFLRRAKISMSSGNIKVEYLYGYKLHDTSGGSCSDRGGYFNYTITCIPIGNVDPAALNPKGGIGPICISF